MKYIDFLKFLICSGAGVYFINLKDYSFAALMFVFAIVGFGFYINETIKDHIDKKTDEIKELIKEQFKKLNDGTK